MHPDQFSGCILRIANRGRRSRWFFTRGTSTPVRAPMRLEAAECCQLRIIPNVFDHPGFDINIVSFHTLSSLTKKHS